MKVKLTRTYVQGYQAPEGERPMVWDTVVTGLYFRVGASGKTYYVFYRYGTKQRHKKIGSADVLTVAQARDLAREVLGRVASGEDPCEKKQPKPKGPVTLRRLLDEYYTPWVTEHRKSGAQTVKMLRSAFDPLMDTDTTEITVPVIENWRSKAKKKGNKDSSVNRKITAVKAMINWGVGRRVIACNAMKGLETLPEHDSSRKVRYLIKEEEVRLLGALEERQASMRKERASHNVWLAERGLPSLPDLKKVPYADHLLPAVILSLNTGLRKGELFTLEWGDIDLERRVLEVRSANAKNGKSRFVPLNDRAMEALEKWKSQTSARGLIFPSPRTGEKMVDCDKAWALALKKAQIENFRWHDMRHDFASKLVMAGVDLNTVRELLGHADIKMTLRYAHLAPEVKAQAVSLIG